MTRKQLTGVVLSLSLAVVACGKAAPCYTVNGKQTREMMDARTILLDVRTRAELSHGTIPGSVHVPVAELSYRLKYLSLATRIIVVGQTTDQAAEAAKYLRNAGYEVFELGPLAALRSDEPTCAP